MWTSGTDAAVSQNLHMYTTMLLALWWREILWMESVDVNEHPTTFWMYRRFSPLKGFYKLRDPPCSPRWFSFQLFKRLFWARTNIPFSASVVHISSQQSSPFSSTQYIQRDVLKEQQLWWVYPPPPHLPWPFSIIGESPNSAVKDGNDFSTATFWFGDWQIYPPLCLQMFNYSRKYMLFRLLQTSKLFHVTFRWTQYFITPHAFLGCWWHVIHCIYHIR